MNGSPSCGTKLRTARHVVGLVLLLAPGCKSRPRTEAPAVGPDGTIYVESVDRMLHAVVPPPRG